MSNRYVRSDQLHSIPFLSDAVIVESVGLVFVSRQIAWDIAGKLVGHGHAAQAAKISEKLDRPWLPLEPTEVTS